MRTLVAATLGWLSLALAAPVGAVERGYAPVNGLRMYCEIHGNPAKDGVPLVLLHGGGSTIETSFGKLIPLVSRTRRVIAFEEVRCPSCLRGRCQCILAGQPGSSTVPVSLALPIRSSRLVRAI